MRLSWVNDFLIVTENKSPLPFLMRDQGQWLTIYYHWKFMFIKNIADLVVIYTLNPRKQATLILSGTLL